jgi:hypothetical protein
MDNYIAEISNIDGNSWLLVAIMCSFGCMLIKILVNSTVFAFFSYPVLLNSSLAANNLVQKGQIFVSAEKAAVVAFSTGVGMALGVMVLISLFYIVSSMYQPSAPKRLDLPRSSRTALE